MIKRILGTAACLMLLNCAGSVIKVMPEYSTMTVDKSRLGVILARENISIKNPNDIADDLGGGDPVQVFGDFFVGEFLPSAKANSRFSDCFSIDDAQPADFRAINEMLTPSESISLRVPQSNSIGADTVPFVLVIDNITIARVQTSGAPVMMSGGGGGGMMRMGGGGGSDNLVLTGTFVVWDNTAGKIVSYGKINEKAGVFIAMTDNTWKTMITTISSKIFIGKPYGKSTQSGAGY